MTLIDTGTRTWRRSIRQPHRQVEPLNFVTVEVGNKRRCYGSRTSALARV